MLSVNNGGLGERSGSLSVFVPYPGHFVTEQKPCLLCDKRLSKFRFPKLDFFFRASLRSYLLFQNEKLVETWGGKSWLRGSQTGGELLHVSDKKKF